MEKAIASFARLRQIRKMVILGDMLELGSESAHGHAAVIRQLRHIGDIRAVLVGPLFREAAADFPAMLFGHQRLLPNG
jgi:UDP-N-acetylmuramyl pentapeptide synthase